MPISIETVIIIARQDTFVDWEVPQPERRFHNFLVAVFCNHPDNSSSSSSFHQCRRRRRSCRYLVFFAVGGAEKHERGIGKTRLPFTCLLNMNPNYCWSDDTHGAGPQPAPEVEPRVLSDSVLTSLFPCNNSRQFIAVANKFIRSGLHNINRPTSSSLLYTTGRR